MITVILKILKKKFQVEEYHIEEIYKNSTCNLSYTIIYRKNGIEVTKEITIE